MTNKRAYKYNLGYVKFSNFANQKIIKNISVISELIASNDLTHTTTHRQINVVTYIITFKKLIKSQ